MELGIHILAARTGDRESFLQALTGVDEKRLVVENGWIYGPEKDWEISAEKLDDQLQSLGKTGFRATMIDEVTWDFHFFHKGQSHLEFHHQFLYADPYREYTVREWRDLRLLEGDQWTVEEAARQIFDLPPSLIKTLDKTPDHELVNRLVDAQASWICQKLEEAGLDFDRPRAEEALRGESLEAAEVEMERGNLPRFLGTLGLKRLWESYQKEWEEVGPDYLWGQGQLQHVVAFWEVDEEDFEEILAPLDLSLVRREGKWIRGMAEAFQIRLPHLKEKLEKFSQSGLWINRIDRDQWILHIYRRGKNLFTYHHHGEEVTNRRWQDWEQYLEWCQGDWNLLAETHFHPLSFHIDKANSIEEGVEMIKEEMAQVVIQHFHKAHLPVDEELLKKVITGRAGTWEVGDLPLLLRSLGLEEAYLEWEEAHREEVEREEVEVDEEIDSDHPIASLAEFERMAAQSDWIARVMDQVVDEPQPLAGKAIEIDLREPQLLYWLAFFLDDGADPAFLIDLPRDQPWERDWLWEREFRIGPWKDRLAVGFPLTGLKWETLKKMRKIGDLLATLPDETDLELYTASKFPGARQIYSGTVEQGKWKIDATYPSLEASALQRAIELARKVEKGEPLFARNQEEVEEILKECKVDVYLRDYRVLAEGLEFKIQGGQDLEFFTPFLAQLIFRHRFRNHWPMEEVFAREEKAREKADEFDDEIREIGEDFARQAAFPGRSKKVWEGDYSDYFALDLDGEEGEKARELFDSKLIGEAVEKLKERNYTHLGDFICEEVPDVALRVFFDPEKEACAALMVGSFGQFALDFVTSFEDGTILTTTTTPVLDENPFPQIIKKSHPSLHVEEMEKKHAHYVSSLEEEGKKALPPPSTKEDFLDLLDSYLLKEQGQ